MRLSDKIVRLRKEKGWSQETLAEKLNVSRQAVSRWEGAIACPDATNILQSVFFGILSFIPFVAVIGGFEYAYQKKSTEVNETTKIFRKKFYKISAWLGVYFPVRFAVMKLATFYPLPYSSIVLECVIQCKELK